jgi:hypothetical protein
MVGNPGVEDGEPIVRSPYSNNRKSGGLLALECTNKQTQPALAVKESTEDFFEKTMTRIQNTLDDYLDPSIPEDQRRSFCDDDVRNARAAPILQPLYSLPQASAHVSALKPAARAAARCSLLAVILSGRYSESSWSRQKLK